MKSQNSFEINIQGPLSFVSVFVSLCVEVSIQFRVSSSIMRQHFPSQGLSLNLGLTDAAHLARQGSEESSCLHLPGVPHHRHELLLLALRQTLGVKLRSLCGCNNHLTNCDS